MNLQSLVVVVLHLMALDVFLRVAVELKPQMVQLLTLYEPSPIAESTSLMVLPFVVVVAMIAAAALLWFLAIYHRGSFIRKGAGMGRGTWAEPGGGRISEADGRAKRCPATRF